MSEINITKVLDELKDNIDEYDIKPLMIKAIRSNFYQSYGIYPDERIINLKETIEATNKNLVSRYTTTYGSLVTARIFYELYPYQYAYRVDKEENEDLILHHYSNLSNSSILSIVRYGINGKFDKDLAEINKLLDEHSPRIVYDSRMWTLPLTEKVTIKSFKSGKVVVSGLTDEQKNRIVAGFEIVAKYRNATI